MNEEPEERAIREQIEAWAAAVRSRDMAGILKNHATDIVMYDVPPPLQLRGIAAYRDSWPQFFDASPKPIRFDIMEMHITAGRDVAFATALMRCAIVEDGNADLDFRLTVGLRKIGGQWIVTHEHHSIPAVN
ncbi:MAG TPA: nuclear transport factor 2 family protein [Micropepsaceae bacterium]|jgi:ketosteroid isomerase-like protein